jgi:hypothetical protein
MTYGSVVVSMNGDVDLGDALSAADPVPPGLAATWRDLFRWRDPSATVAELVEDSSEPDALGSRRFLFDAGDVSVAVDVVRAGDGLTVTARLEPPRARRGALRTPGYESDLDLEAGTVGPSFLPRAPFSLAFELDDGRRVHTEWMLP